MWEMQDPTRFRSRFKVVDLLPAVHIFAIIFLLVKNVNSSINIPYSVIVGKYIYSALTVRRQYEVNKLTPPESVLQ
jgi:hypothetical protein